MMAPFIKRRLNNPGPAASAYAKTWLRWFGGRGGPKKIIIFKQKGPNREWRRRPGPYSIPELASSKKRITTYFGSEITYYSQLFITSCLFFILQQKKNQISSTVPSSKAGNFN